MATVCLWSKSMGIDIIDGQTGRVLGPYRKSDLFAQDRLLLHQLLRWLIEQHYKGENNPGPTTDYRTELLDFHYAPVGEPPPWYTDPAMRDHFKDKMDIPDDAGLDPYIWNSGVAPGGS